MRQTYRSYYRPTRSDFETLWRDGIFAVDANVLLNLYRYSDPARSDLLAILGKLQSQLWLPHQAGLEFHRNRAKVMTEQRAKFSSERSAVKATRARVEALYRDPARAADTRLKSLEEAWAKLDDYLAEQEALAIVPTMSTDDDPVLAAVTTLLEGRVGEPLDQARMNGLAEEGRQRYAVKVPPGFEDIQKPEPDRYGDLVIWYQ